MQRHMKSKTRRINLKNLLSRRWVRRVLLVVGVLIIMGLIVLGSAYQGLKPPAPGAQVRFQVKSGETSAEVTQDLKRNGLVRSAFWFRIYLSWTGAGRHLQAGAYQLPIGSSVSEIAYAMVGGVVADDTVTVTIPEGFTVVEIANRLQQDGVCGAKAFLTAEQRDVFNESFLTQRSQSPAVKYRLEGYLFPDTYQFVRNEPPHQVIDLMLQNFDRRTAPLMRTAQATGMSLNQLVTVASLIEQEAKVDDERPIIASVIDNRLNRGMMLQIDATVEYVVGHRDVLTDTDLAVADPYNTYQHAGLPPGPIANPGLASLEAALHPAKTDYLYYVVKNDGTGRDYFAVTYAEQLRNIQRSQANLRAHS